MQLSDPIADMLTRLRNGLMARHTSVDIPHSNMKEHIAQILVDEGFVRDYEVVRDGAKVTLRVVLKYTPQRRPVMTHLRRLSKPGLRIYTGKDRIPRVLGGIGLVIISTPRGVITGQHAKRLGVGGELLCEVW
ncbi:MAG: ribosomal protein [Chloroflexi bacterium]|jgi:small subunit ribosomal protein S8|nr:ribosomal protein [Chloroflexota bacterium]